MNVARQIAMGKPRKFEDIRLANASPERVREVSVVESAYESVLCADFTYVSTPITSGAALYSAMDAVGATTPEELKQHPDAFRTMVMDVNLAAAETVARAMLSFGGAVIAPAAFEARSLGWDQDAYMGLWLDTIERKATRIAMVDGWQYSNGGVEEYLQALLMQAGRRDREDIQIVDGRGSTLHHDVAIELMAAAVDDLVTRGFQPITLIRTAHRVNAVHQMVDSELSYGIMTDQARRQSNNISRFYGMAHPGSAIWPSIRRSMTVLEPVLKMLSIEDRLVASSTQIAPGLVRDSEREMLSDMKADLKIPDGDED